MGRVFFPSRQIFALVDGGLFTKHPGLQTAGARKKEIQCFVYFERDSRGFAD